MNLKKSMNLKGGGRSVGRSGDVAGVAFEQTQTSTSTETGDGILVEKSLLIVAAIRGREVRTHRNVEKEKGKERRENPTRDVAKRMARCWKEVCGDAELAGEKKSCLS